MNEFKTNKMIARMSTPGSLRLESSSPGPASFRQVSVFEAEKPHHTAQSRHHLEVTPIVPQASRQLLSESLY